MGSGRWKGMKVKGVADLGWRVRRREKKGTWVTGDERWKEKGYQQAVEQGWAAAGTLLTVVPAVMHERQVVGLADGLSDMRRLEMKRREAFEKVSNSNKEEGKMGIQEKNYSPGADKMKTTVQIGCKRT